MKTVLAGYGLPAEYGLTELFGRGARPQDVFVLSHPADHRNRGFHEVCTLRTVRVWTELKSAECRKALQAFSPDTIVSLHFRSRIPRDVLTLARLGSVNLHPSLLPKYRGTNSVAWAIINGEETTGFTYHRMEAEFDTGNILLQNKLPIAPNETAFSLFHRQIARALPLLGDVLALLERGEPGTRQPDSGSYFGRNLPFDGVIDPSWELDRVDRFIRAMYFPPFPGAKFSTAQGMVECRTFADFVRARASESHS